MLANKANKADKANKANKAVCAAALRCTDLPLISSFPPNLPGFRVCDLCEGAAVCRRSTERDKLSYFGLAAAYFPAFSSSIIFPAPSVSQQN